MPSRWLFIVCVASCVSCIAQSTFAISLNQFQKYKLILTEQFSRVLFLCNLEITTNVNEKKTVVCC
jgi:hypothetical protein